MGTCTEADELRTWVGLVERFGENWKQSSPACSGVSKAAGVSHALAIHKNAACLQAVTYCAWMLFVSCHC